MSKSKRGAAAHHGVAHQIAPKARKPASVFTPLPLKGFPKADKQFDSRGFGGKRK